MERELRCVYASRRAATDGRGVLVVTMINAWTVIIANHFCHGPGGELVPVQGEEYSENVDL